MQKNNGSKYTPEDLKIISASFIMGAYHGAKEAYQKNSWITLVTETLAGAFIFCAIFFIIKFGIDSYLEQNSIREIKPSLFVVSILISVAIGFVAFSLIGKKLA